MKRTHLAALGLGLLILLVWIAWVFLGPGMNSEGGGSHAVAAPASPSGTARAIKSRSEQSPSPPPALEVSPGDVSPVEVITVQLGDPTRRPRVLRYILFFRSQGFWPSPDEAPLPAGAASSDLQAMLDLEGSGEGNRETLTAARDTFLQSARDEGLLELDPALAADPWQALVALEAGHREASRHWLATIRDARATGNDEGGEHPQKDYAPILQLALAVVEQHPDDPAADFARLYVMDAYTESLANTHDPEAGTDVILDILASTDDSLVAETAAQQLANLSRGPAIAANQLDALFTQLGSQYDPLARTALAQYGLDQAFALKDAERVDAWMNRFAEILTARCPGGRGEETCRALLDELALSRGQAAAAWGVDANDWRSSLVAAVWRCHGQEAFEGPDTTGEGSWDQEWTWDSWAPDETAFTDCLEEETDAAVGPDDGVAVRLRVKGKSRMILL